MCHENDFNSNFHWNEGDCDDMDHTYLVSDGENIALAGRAIDSETGEFYWHGFYGHKEAIYKVGYYGNHVTNDMMGLNEIKYWSPIPSIKDFLDRKGIK